MSVNYVPQQFENGKTVLKAEHLEQIERGITNLVTEINEHTINHPSGGSYDDTELRGLIRGNKDKIDRMVVSYAGEDVEIVDSKISKLYDSKGSLSFPITTTKAVKLKDGVGTLESKLASTDNKLNTLESDLAEHLLNHPQGEGEFPEDWGIVANEEGSSPSSGFPIGYDKYYVAYNDRWIVFNNNINVSNIKLHFKGNSLESNESVNYKYSYNGTTWSTYTDTIKLSPSQGLSSVYECTMDIYNADLTTITRPKDSFGVIDTTVQVQMSRGDTFSVSSYVGKQGQLVVDTEKKQLHIMDGVTAGGTIIQGGTSGGFSGNYNDLTNKPSTFPPSSHRHNASEIDGLPSGGSGEWLGAKPITDFGAIGDGATDNTVAFQEAINWSDSNFKSVYIPSGRYKIDGTLYLKQFASFKGDNRLGGYSIYGDNNISDVVLICNATNIFKGYNNGETALHKTELCLEGINFQLGNATQQRRLDSVLFYKLELLGTYISHCLFRGFGVWLMGAISQVTTIERNTILETAKYFMQSRDVPGMGDFGGMVDSRVINNYINGTSTNTFEKNVAFYTKYPTYSTIQSNFVDYFYRGIDIYNNEATTISDNEFQVCNVGVYLMGVNGISMYGNRFGIMERNKLPANLTRPITTWDSKFSGIMLDYSCQNVACVANVGSSVDVLIKKINDLPSTSVVFANVGGVVNSENFG